MYKVGRERGGGEKKIKVKERKENGGREMRWRERRKETDKQTERERARERDRRTDRQTDRN